MDPEIWRADATLDGTCPSPATKHGRVTVPNIAFVFLINVNQEIQILCRSIHATVSQHHTYNGNQRCGYVGVKMKASN